MMPEQSHNRRAVRSPGLLVASGVILCLLLSRFFLAAESAGQGDTLWIVALWCVGLLMWTVVSWRSYEFSFGGLDFCVALLAGGHIVSALVVIATAGEKRGALNLAWEWVGLSIGWFLLRQLSRRSAFRREILIGLIATGTTVAGQGLYQHYVEFPELAAKYGPLFDRLKSANTSEAASIRQSMASEHIPTDGPSLILFEKRLRDSREPLGFFALANTLGGVLAVCLILAITVAVSEWRTVGHDAWRRLWPWIPIIVLLGWCLLLTKSRTAWIGTATGLMAWSLSTARIKFNAARARGIAGSLTILALMGWGLSRVGGLDRQVLTEAPKSLEYRLQYWTATWPMIQDHLWLGVGPGQFRMHYLFYKLPEASEEIADPHDLFLDVAANGGIVALAGLLAISVALVLKFRTLDDQIVATGSEISDSSVLVPYVVSGFVAVAWGVLLFTGEDDRLLVLLPVAVALLWALRRIVSPNLGNAQVTQIASLSAAIALLVHLLGAGGIGMPAIGLLLLGLAAIADGSTWGRLSACDSNKTRGSRVGSLPHVDGSQPSSTKPRSQDSIGLAGTLVVASVGLLVAVILTAWRPVRVVQAQLLAGDRLVERGFLDAADVEYSKAATADPLSEEPWSRRAELAYRKAEADHFRSNDSFLNAVRLMREAGSRNPVNFQEDRRLGDWWMARWRVTNQVEDAREAVTAYQHAWIRYPTNSMLMADLAFALDAAGTADEARAIAERAIQQDEINRKWKHIDRFLADPIRTQLDKLAARSTEH